MFHKIKNLSPLPDYRLSVQFAEGCTKIYDVKPLFKQISAFEELKDSNLFSMQQSMLVDMELYGTMTQIYHATNYGKTELPPKHHLTV